MFSSDDGSLPPLYEPPPLDATILYDPLKDRVRRINAIARLRWRQKMAREASEYGSSDEDETTVTNGLKSVILNGDSAHENGKDVADVKEVPAETVEPGMQCGLKNLYSGKEDKRGRFRWQDTIPADVGKPAEDAETAKWALLVRNVKVYNDPRKVLAIQ